MVAFTGRRCLDSALSVSKQLLLLISSLLSNPDNVIHYMQYTSVKNLASLKRHFRIKCTSSFTSIFWQCIWKLFSLGIFLWSPLSISRFDVYAICGPTFKADVIVITPLLRSHRSVVAKLMCGSFEWGTTNGIEGSELTGGNTVTMFVGQEKNNKFRFLSTYGMTHQPGEVRRTPLDPPLAQVSHR